MQACRNGGQGSNQNRAADLCTTVSRHRSSSSEYLTSTEESMREPSGHTGAPLGCTGTHCRDKKGVRTAPATPPPADLQTRRAQRAVKGRRLGTSC